MQASKAHVIACALHAYDLKRVYAPHLLVVPKPVPVAPPPIPDPEPTPSHRILAGCVASEPVRAKLFQVCTRFDVTYYELASPSRSLKYLEPRAIMYRWLREYGWSTTRIGQFFKRDHTSVSHALSKARDL